MITALRTGLRRTVIRCSITTWLLALAMYFDLMPSTGVMIWNGYHS